MSNKKNLPGFTAEASLYKTSEHYHTIGTGTFVDGAIHPAVRDPECVDNCAIKCAGRGRFAQACFNHCVNRCPVLLEETF